MKVKPMTLQDIKEMLPSVWKCTCKKIAGRYYLHLSSRYDNDMISQGFFNKSKWYGDETKKHVKLIIDFLDKNGFTEELK